MEYTTTNVLTYKHFVPTTTFESNRYNLGHYLTDNAIELCLNLGWKPLRTLLLELSYTDIQKGPDHTALGTMTREKIAPFVPIVYESRSLELTASWQIINDLGMKLGFIHRNVSGEPTYMTEYSPEFWWGKTNSLNISINFGF